MKIRPSLQSGVSLAILLLQVAVVGATPLKHEDASTDATAVLPQGTVKGFTDSHGNSVFLGIPFAATTGGDNRYESLYETFRTCAHDPLQVESAS